MPIYFVAYDLTKKKPEFDYEILWNELKRLGSHRTQLSAWLVNVNNTAQDLTRHLKQFVHSDDRIWTIRLTKQNGITQYDYVNALNGTNDWLKNNPVT
jgi:CRISPR-associated endonuclease Cas2